MESPETQPSPGADSHHSSTAAWQSLTRNQRRVLGVLIEKSKTTPDVYPMSLNGIKTGSNQKTNRGPVLDLNENQVEDTLYELRQMGCVIEVHSGGRVPKFKHQAYDWLGVDKPELGVMAELLLRGEQSVGDLRARSARMEKSISGLEELRPILASLIQKNLVVELTPTGRGQMVTHNLYRPEELAQLRQQFDNGTEDSDRSDHAEDAGNRHVAPLAAAKKTADAATTNSKNDSGRIEKLQQCVDELADEVSQLKQEAIELRQELVALRQLIES